MNIKNTKNIKKIDALDPIRFESIPSAQLLKLKAGAAEIVVTDVAGI